MRWYYCVLFDSAEVRVSFHLLLVLFWVWAARNPLNNKKCPVSYFFFLCWRHCLYYTLVIASLKLLQWTLLGDKNHVPVQSSFSEFTNNNHHRPEALVRMRAKVKARKKQMAFLQNVFPIEICKQLTYFTTTTTSSRPDHDRQHHQQHFVLLHIIIIIDFCYLSVHGYESLSLLAA